MSILRRSDLLSLALLALSAVTTLSAVAAPSDDAPFAQYRERFKQGLDRYNDGAFAEAVGYWEPVFRELGERDGYRLAYNLGVAYMQLGDATHAADRLQTFLARVDERRGAGEGLGGVVAKEEADARARMADLTTSKGRIEIVASSPPPAVKVDAADPRLAGFTAWVAPGAHVVVVAPGTPDEETRNVSVQAGEIVRVTPLAKAAAEPPPSGPALAPVPIPAPPPTLAPAPVSTPPGAPPPSLQLVLLSGGVAVATTVAAVALDVNAQNLYSRLVAEERTSPDHVISPGDRGSFDTARTGAYVAIGCAAGFAALTSGLAAWYALGSPKQERAVTPTVGLGQVGLAGRF